MASATTAANDNGNSTEPATPEPATPAPASASQREMNGLPATMNPTSPMSSEPSMGGTGGEPSLGAGEPQTNEPDPAMGGRPGMMGALGTQGGTGGTAPSQPEPEASGGASGAQGTGEDCVPDLTCTPEPIDTGDYYADCVTRVNQFRACVCLPPLERNRDAEACADMQAEYDTTRNPHDGFSSHVCDPRGNGQNECPGWRDDAQVVGGCLQMMFDEGPPPQEPCDGQCFQDHGHFINMTGDFTSVACGKAEYNGQLWAVQNFF